MPQQASIVLRDGTTLDDLIMRDSNEVSLRVMTDEEQGTASLVTFGKQQIEEHLSEIHVEG